jgi:hypothetical protein
MTYSFADEPEESPKRVLIVASEPLSDQTELKLTQTLERRLIKAITLLYCKQEMVSGLEPQLLSKDNPVTHVVFFLERKCDLTYETDVLALIRRVSHAPVTFVCRHTFTSLEAFGKMAPAYDDFVVVTNSADHSAVRRAWRIRNSLVAENIGAEIEHIADMFLGMISPHHQQTQWA